MAARWPASGAMPWALAFASSMPVAHRSPTIFFTPPALASAAACSASWCCTALERSSSISNAPQLVRSAGIGLAASQVSLAKPAKSTQASLDGSRSEMAKRFTPGRVLSSRVYSGASVAALAADGVASSCLAQAASATAMASGSSRVLGLRMFTSWVLRPGGRASQKGAPGRGGGGECTPGATQAGLPEVMPGTMGAGSSGGGACTSNSMAQPAR